MRRSTEMKKQLAALKNKMEMLQSEGKIKEAHDLLEEWNELKQSIAVQEALEFEEAENFKGEEIPTRQEEVNPTVVFNKLVLNRPLTEAEQAYVEEAYNSVGTPGQAEHTDEKGGYLVPEEQYMQIKELKRKSTVLKDYCNVIPVKSMSGKMPIEVEASEKLTNFEELNEMKKSDMNFAQLKWSVKDYGDIIPISNTLLADEKVNLTSYIGRRFAKKAVNTENDEILKVLKTAKKVTGTTYEDLKTVLNTKLDPAISSNAIILTNQTGFDYLDKLKDKNDRPLLSDSMTDPTQKTFKGRQVVVCSDADLPAAGAKKMTYYIGDMEEFVAFFDRTGVEMAVSDQAGFTKNATLMRVIERFDVQKVDAEAMVHLELTIA